MIAARWVLLLVATMCAVVAFGVDASELPPSAVRLVVASIVALLAPLFWPGEVETPSRSVLRVGAWSLAAAALAALISRLLGGAAQAALPVLATAGMLLAILVPVHAAAALLERRLRQHEADAARARDAAGRVVALALAGAAALPLFMGPAVELLSARYGDIVDAVVAVSPLTHLAVASGNDLLRNDWLYRHSNLAALAVSYPDPRWLAAAYAAAWLPALIVLARRRGPGIGPAPSIETLTEQRP